MIIGAGFLAALAQALGTWGADVRLVLALMAALVSTGGLVMTIRFQGKRLEEHDRKFEQHEDLLDKLQDRVAGMVPSPDVARLDLMNERFLSVQDRLDRIEKRESRLEEQQQKILEVVLRVRCPFSEKE